MNRSNNRSETYSSKFYKIRRIKDQLFFNETYGNTIWDELGMIWNGDSHYISLCKYGLEMNTDDLKEGDLEIVEFSLVEVGMTKTEKGTLRMKQKS